MKGERIPGHVCLDMKRGAWEAERAKSERWDDTRSCFAWIKQIYPAGVSWKGLRRALELSVFMGWLVRSHGGVILSLLEILTIWTWAEMDWGLPVRGARARALRQSLFVRNDDQLLLLYHQGQSKQAYCTFRRNLRTDWWRWTSSYSSSWEETCTSQYCCFRSKSNAVISYQNNKETDG